MTGPSLLKGIPSYLFVSLLLIGLSGLFALRADGTSMLAAGAVAAVGSGAYLAYRRSLSGRPWSDLGFVRPGSTDLAFGVAAGLASFLAATAYAALRLPGAQGSNQLAGSAVGLRWAAPYVLGLGGLAFSEECIFRAYLIPALEERVGPWTAVALSAALFAASHTVEAGKVLVPGLIYGAVFVRRRNVWSAVTAHLVHNLGVVTAAYWIVERAAGR